MCEWMGYAERVGAEMTDYFGLIAEPDVRIPVRDIMQLAGLKYLCFTHLDESQLQHGVVGERPEIGLRLRLGTGIDFWSQQLREQNRKLVSETERIERRIQREHGPLRFCFAETDWANPLRNLVHYKRRQYVRTRGADMFGEPWRVRLLEALADSEQRSCTGVLSTLYAGESWVASHFGLRSGHVLHYWFPVYNPDMASFSPGRLLLKQVIRSASEAGVDLLDRGAGDTYSKRQFTNEEHNYYRGAWYRAGVRSTAVRIHQSFKWRLDRAGLE
jgi:CelD/BcsL family acetyltransferase involved in cellulose biosynthesis